ncbi:MAG TPA: archease [Sphingobacteriaceae bacterium]|nr:archease [Sphingobacteriaceae bacterium]
MTGKAGYEAGGAGEPTAAGFRLFAHTADAGIEAWGRDPATAFAGAAQALFTMICPPESVEGRRQWPVEARAPAPDLLLVDYLEEIIYLHEVEGAVFREARIDQMGREPAGPGGRAAWFLRGVLVGEPVDKNRHVIHGHVKAVTLHDLLVEERPAGWYLRVIVDL